MKSTLLNFFSVMRASYWFTPLFMAILAILLSMITLSIDHYLDAHWEMAQWFQSYNPEGARAILSTIAGVMVTVVSVTFSMTLVAISFTAGQIGPRLTSNFMRDRANQITLGIFIATFLFCLMILRAVSNASVPTGHDSTYIAAFVPQLSLFVAILLTITSIIVLIYYFHHIPDSINMSNVVAGVGVELNRQVDCIFPKGVGKEQPTKSNSIPEEYLQYHEPLPSITHGYIRILDGCSLINLAQKHHLIIQLEVSPGDYVTQGTKLLSFHSSEPLDDGIRDACRNVFAFGYQRNQEQDIFFLVSELVEIIARALSPGVNDPFSAMNCMDWFQLILQKVSNINLASPYRYDEEDQLRLITHAVSFQEFCERIFCCIQPYVSKDRNASMHLMTMIYKLSNTIYNQEHQNILTSYARALNEAGQECLSLNEDRQALQKMYEQYFKL